MHTIHIQRLGDNGSPCTAGFSIEKDDGISFICACYTKNSTLTNTIHRICTDYIMELNPSAETASRTFTELLEDINHELDGLYHQYKKSEVSLFLGLVHQQHVHFSTFGTELTGIIVSPTNVEDIFSDMDTGDGHFVYDSHGDIRDKETLFIFAPKVDTHIIGMECKNLTHLSMADRCQLLADRIERSYSDDSIIIGIGEETVSLDAPHWNPKKMSIGGKKGAMVLDNMRKISDESIRKIQSGFSNLGQKTQNWVIISGLTVSIVLLYLIITSVMNTQYTLFVPQKYKDMVAEARVSLDDATRMVDQPDNFGPAITKARDIIGQIKAADVLKVDVAQLENDIAILERAVNKVTSLKTEEYNTVYKFTKTVDSLPFSLYAYDNKLTLVTQNSVIGPFIAGEAAKETPIPNGDKFTFSDIDGEGRIYLGTGNDKIYLYDKGIFSTLNIQQLGGWDKSNGISIYNSNIYLLANDNKQIYKYRRQAENTYSGRSFVMNDTQKNPVVSMDIDGSIWLLSQSSPLSLEKILTAPQYERRPIPMNGLGINSFQNVNPDTTKIYAGELYQEIYILSDNRIWVFVPNSKRFTDVRSVNYIGQIDIPNVIITDISVEQNGDVRTIYFGSPKSGIFSTKMTIKENKIQILPSK